MMGLQMGICTKMRCLGTYYLLHHGEGLKKWITPTIQRVPLEDSEIVFKVSLNLKQPSLLLHSNLAPTSTRSPQCSANSVLTRSSQPCSTIQVTTPPCVLPNTVWPSSVPIPNSTSTPSSYNWWTSSSIRWLRVWRCSICPVWMSIKSRHSGR